MIDLKVILDDEIAKLERRVRQAAQERDESATPTESTHDQTRQVANQLFNSLLEEKSKLQKLENVVKKFLIVLKIEKESGEIINVMPVPDGLGGKNIDGVLLVGESSPLGQRVKGLKAGDSYEMNGERYKVIGSTKQEA